MSGLFDELPMTSAGIETERVDGGTTATPSSVPSSPETPTDSSLPSPTLSQHPEFWFTDGSIILVAQDMMFRVHKSFLSRHSVIFRDMFSLPQPSLSSLNSSRPISQDVDVRRLEDTEGCSAVWLHDSAEDVSSLLYALYDGPKFGNNDRSDFRVVSGILRLASKYVIDSLRTKALEHLSIAWPSTLKGWDAREEILGDSWACTEEPRYYPNPVEVINLAREINAISLLPSAFYDLSRYPLTEIFEHGQRMSDIRESLGLHQLSLPDTQKLVLGKESAQYAVTSLIRSMATEAKSNPNFTHHRETNAAHAQTMRGHFTSRHRRSDSNMFRCTSPSSCWRDVCELVDLATQHYLFDRERGALDPLYVAEELALLKGSDMGGAGASVGNLSEDGESSTCKACARAFELWAKKEREKLWKAIPTWFRLDQ